MWCVGDLYIVYRRHPGWIQTHSRPPPHCSLAPSCTLSVGASLALIISNNWLGGASLPQPNKCIGCKPMKSPKVNNQWASTLWATQWSSQQMFSSCRAKNLQEKYVLQGMPCCAICCQHCSAIMVAVHAWSYLHMLFVVGLLGISSWRIFLHNISKPCTRLYVPVMRTQDLFCLVASRKVHEYAGLPPCKRQFHRALMEQQQQQQQQHAARP